MKKLILIIILMFFMTGCPSWMHGHTAKIVIPVGIGTGVHIKTEHDFRVLEKKVENGTATKEEIAEYERIIKFNKDAEREHRERDKKLKNQDIGPNCG